MSSCRDGTVKHNDTKDKMEALESSTMAEALQPSGSKDRVSKCLTSSDGAQTKAVLYSLPRTVFLTLQKVLVPDKEQRASALPAVLLAVESYPLERLTAVLPTLLLIAHHAPFTDLQEAFKSLLPRLDRQALAMAQLELRWSQMNRASAFVSDVYWDDKEEEIVNIFEGEFLRTGRVSNLSKILAWHPTYLGSFMKTEKVLMSEEGPLNVQWRHYIAVMAASRHQCRYLVTTHIALFLRHGGDPSWIQGTDHIPIKLRGLLELNALLAHKPWAISAQTIAALASGDSLVSGTGWSIAEIVHATVLLAHYHTLAGVIFSNGVLPEVDIVRAFAMQGKSDLVNSLVNSLEDICVAAAKTNSDSNKGSGFDNTKMNHLSDVTTTRFKDENDISNDKLNSNSNDIPSVDSSVGNQSLDTNVRQNLNISSPFPKQITQKTSFAQTEASMTLQSLVEAQAPGDVNLHEDTKSSDLSKISRDETRLRAHLVAAGSEGDLEALLGDEAEGGAIEADLPADFQRAADLGDANVRARHNVSSDLCVYTGDYPLAYADFHCPSVQRVKIMRLQDCCWEDHCFALLSRFFESSASPLDRQFREIYNLTYYTLGEEADIDTLPFRRAVWYYAQSLLGIRNDDYDYREVNVLINIPTKVYVKKVVCYPESTTAEDFALFSTSLLPSEKCHISLLAANARMQGSLIYALRAIGEHMM